MKIAAWGGTGDTGVASSTFAVPPANYLKNNQLSCGVAGVAPNIEFLEYSLNITVLYVLYTICICQNGATHATRSLKRLFLLTFWGGTSYLLVSPPCTPPATPKINILKSLHLIPQRGCTRHASR